MQRIVQIVVVSLESVTRSLPPLWLVESRTRYPFGQRRLASRWFGALEDIPNSGPCILKVRSSTRLAVASVQAASNRASRSKIAGRIRHRVPSTIAQD